MAELNVTDDQMQAIVASIITEQMSGEQRTKIITSAVTALLTPKAESNYYSSPKKSPLAECFERAVYIYAEKASGRYLDEHPEIQRQIDAVIADGFKKALVTDREGTVQKVADAVSKALHDR